MRIVEIDFFHGDDLSLLQMAMMVGIADGYQPFGQTIVAPNGRCYHAMVQYADDDENNDERLERLIYKVLVNATYGKFAK